MDIKIRYIKTPYPINSTNKLLPDSFSDCPGSFAIFCQGLADKPDNKILSCRCVQRSLFHSKNKRGSVAAADSRRVEIDADKI